MRFTVCLPGTNLFWCKTIMSLHKLNVSRLFEASLNILILRQMTGKAPSFKVILTGSKYDKLSFAQFDMLCWQDKSKWLNMNEICSISRWYFESPKCCHLLFCISVGIHFNEAILKLYRHAVHNILLYKAYTYIKWLFNTEGGKEKYLKWRKFTSLN